MAIRVEGLRQYTRALEKAGVDVDDLKDVFARIATRHAQVIVKFIPKRSRALANSARGNRAKNRTTVTIGKARVRYAGPINYGWPKRHIRGAQFGKRADDELSTEVPRMLEDGLRDVCHKNGIEIE